MRLVINNGFGYDVSEIKAMGKNKYRLSGELVGNKNLLKKAIANVNRGEFYVMRGSDSLVVSIQK